MNGEQMDKISHQDLKEVVREAYERRKTTLVEGRTGMKRKDWRYGR